MIVNHIKGSQMIYERNPDYWDSATINGKKYQLPFVDKVVLPVIPDEATRFAALRTGQVDFYTQASWRYKDSLAKTNPELISYVAAPGLGDFISMRMDTPPFDDIRVRRALNLAIDQEAMNDSLLGGTGMLLNHQFPRRFAEYTPIEDYPEEFQELFEYKPEKAKQLLAEAGYPDGFETEFTIPTTFLTGMPSLIVDYWSQIGVDCEINAVDYATWTSIWMTTQHKDMIFQETGTASPLVALQRATTGYGINSAIFSDSYYDEGYESAIKESDDEKRFALAKELNKYFMQSVPQIFLPVSGMYAYAGPWVKRAARPFG